MKRIGVAVCSAIALGACVPGVDEGAGEPQPTVPHGGPFGPGPVFQTPPVTSAKPARPLSGGTLAMLADGRTAVATDPDRDRVFVADVRRGELIADVALTNGDEPWRHVQDRAGRVHVSLRGGGAIATIEPGGWTVAARRPVCAAPRGLAYDAAQDQLHVACATGELVSLPAAPDGGPVRTLRFERDLRDVVVRGDRLYVSVFRSADVMVVDGAGKVERRWRPANARTFVATPVEESSNRLSKPRTAGQAPVPAAVAWRLLPGPRDGEVLMVHQRALEAEVSLEPGGYGGASCGGIVQSAVTRVGSDVPSAAIVNSTLPVDMAVSPDGRKVAVVAAGNAHAQGAMQVFLSDQTAFTAGSDCVFPGADPGFPGRPLPPPQSDPPPVGGPDAGAVADAGASGTDSGTEPPVLDDPGSNVPLEFRQPEGEAVAVVFDSLGNVIVQTREPATIQVLTVRGGRTIRLTDDSRKDTGHAVFHSNSGAGLACASCHPEGGEDGRVWRFAKIGPRRTQSLRGGVMSTAPFHWDGDLRGLDNLMTEVFVRRMQGPTVDKKQVGALGRWIDAIPALPHGSADPAAVARGKALFDSAQVGCATCHGGPLLTNNQTTDVGTGRALQVPSLRGVAWRAPFMHDGCARTLSDRFSGSCGGADDKHGVISTLGAQQIADLVAYMETL